MEQIQVWTTNQREGSGLQYHLSALDPSGIRIRLTCLSCERDTVHKIVLVLAPTFSNTARFQHILIVCQKRFEIRSVWIQRVLLRDFLAAQICTHISEQRMQKAIGWYYTIAEKDWLAINRTTVGSNTRFECLISTRWHVTTPRPCRQILRRTIATRLKRTRNQILPVIGATRKGTAMAPQDTTRGSVPHMASGSTSNNGVFRGVVMNHAASISWERAVVIASDGAHGHRTKHAVVIAYLVRTHAWTLLTIA